MSALPNRIDKQNSKTLRADFCARLHSSWSGCVLAGVAQDRDSQHIILTSGPSYLQLIPGRWDNAHTPRLQINSNVVMQILVDWFHQRMRSRHRVAYMLPMYYLQRGRIAEALHAYTAVKDGFQGSQGSAEEQEQQQQLEGLLESAARMLPAAQQGLATAPHQTHGGPALALTTTTAAGQGARSILGGIQNMQLADDQDIPMLLIRQCGKLPPPLLTSTLHQSNLFLPDDDLRKDNNPSEQGVAAASAVPSPKPSRLGRSALKAAGTTPTSSSLLTGRLNSQAKGRASLPSALRAAAGSPGTTPAASGQTDGERAVVTTPAAATAASQGQEEAAQTPSQWTQEQWDAYMQGGSPAPTSTGKATGRKKAVRPVLKKQRMNTIVLD